MLKILEDKKLVYLVVTVLIFLALRIPLLNKPLQHDEIYSTYTYLHTAPFFNAHTEKSINLDYSGWAADWERQIAMHPPLSYVFNYFWIRLFGDSALSLHLPALIAGLGGTILFFYVGILLFGPELSFLAILATTISVSHIGFSTFGTYTIFEFFIFGASLLFFIKFMETKNRTLLNMLMTLNLLGVLLFYHYMVYLTIQTVILWVYRNNTKIPRHYFIGFAVAFIGVVCTVVVSSLRQQYNYTGDFFLKNDLNGIITTIAWLPFCFTAERAVTTMAKILMQTFCIFLFAIFCWGSFSAIISSVRSKDRLSLLRLMLVALFILPFLVYLVLGFLGLHFGHQQNFFYLLPTYYFFIFYGLTLLSRRKVLFHTLLVIIFTVLATSAVISCPILWNHRFPEKEVSGLAAKLNADFSILVGVDGFTSSYYLKRYGILDKTFISLDPTLDESGFLSYLNECAGKVRNLKRFAIIRKMAGGGMPLKNEHVIGNKTFRLVDTTSYEYPILRVGQLQKFIKKPLTITVSIFSTT